eukprot:CAMPEP_0119383464 /NCGR_PEP_ID=MMETSP1334-20130426/79691_1 /TAXON_ID=127549 /ORGANISM="Calcidiscus leptoporus, Strain RCC1130" /LENGTH=199 /DNA_ID=CAMNT_0007404273 /DNA_START=1 /DNA_END=600 /DNA_ORIENTATION=+
MSKALLIAQPSIIFDRSSSQVIRLPFAKSTVGELASRLERFNRGEFYAPSASAVAAVKGETRDRSMMADPIDVGFAALRLLGSAIAGAEALRKSGSSCANGPSVRLRQSSVVSAGSLLITHPVACLLQPTLHRAVILIVSADRSGVFGVLLNKRLGMSLGEAVSSAELRDELRGIADEPMHLGGDVGRGGLLVTDACNQ